MPNLSFEQALTRVLEHASRVAAADRETVELPASRGRVLAGVVCADRDQPPFDRATRDGFAVRAGEWCSGTKLRVAGQVRAGEEWSGDLRPGQAVEIMTGAPVPRGADAVAMVEHAIREDTDVRAAAGRTLAPGDNVVPRGSEARSGDVVLPQGIELTASEIAMAAACGAATLEVFRRPRVAIVATGDELVEVTERPAAHQVRNSNSYALAALVAAVGGEPRVLPIARDHREDLRERIRAGAGEDLLLLSGGVSAGQYDLVEEVLAEFGAEFLFTGVAMQPGKPAVFGRMPVGDGWRYFFGLPGNPVSTEVTFHCFAAVMIRALGGAAEVGPRFVQATLAEEVAAREALTRVLPARLTHALHGPAVRLVSWRSSGDLAANARANCYAVLPDGAALHAGNAVTVLLR